MSQSGALEGFQSRSTSEGRPSYVGSALDSETGVWATGREVCRQLRIAVWILGLLAAPTSSLALTLYHSADPNGANPETLPLRLAEGSPASLDLWIDSVDPDEATILALDMKVKSPGSLSLSFTCDLLG